MGDGVRVFRDEPIVCSEDERTGGAASRGGRCSFTGGRSSVGRVLLRPEGRFADSVSKGTSFLRSAGMLADAMRRGFAGAEAASVSRAVKSSNVVEREGASFERTSKGTSDRAESVVLLILVGVDSMRLLDDCDVEP